MYRMATIETRLKQLAYKNEHFLFSHGEREPKSDKVIFLICEELKEEDFKEPFFKGVINLSNGFKFLTYCGKDQKDKINKNALVIQKKLKKGDKVIYRVYLMDNKEFKIRDLFLKFSGYDTIGEHNGYNLSPNYYIGSIKEIYNKKELIYIINQIQNFLVEESLKEK